MRLIATVSLAALALAACTPTMPDSGAGSRETQLSGGPAIPAAASVSAQPLVSEGAAIAAETSAALGLSTQSQSGGAPMSAMSPSATSADGTTGSASVATVEDGTQVTNPGAALSDEQNFQAVASRETIESDAERIAENRARYVQIEPTQLPQREGGNGASIVQYALKTNNPLGQQMYSRTGFAAEARFQRNCAKYTSPDRAQEAFLDAGGPQRDRMGIDPDGDGFACYWDPTPFREARNGAPEVVTQYVDVETPGVSE
ncbi:hypothetical protein [Maritimibacter dapengensis]|uniref:Excalibur calcium-binding domain-containing protein n=1 Tax=Maritimibacter dapengensis TaxID=2836868 RepID=A0ABS6T087_9RHOB|nr:hypothetical protein [Maritimibacter dapengensis]MBV7378653.1 hypothetical protein [Maritimibacter dapengensis]